MCCYWGKRAKNGLKWHKILSIALRKHTSYNFHVWYRYTFVKWSFFQVFLFCHFFKGVNGQKRVQNDKNVRHLSNPMIVPPGFFPLFFQIFIFRFVSGVKGLKLVQNDKKLCLLRSIYQEPYIIWFSYMVHICKMIISPRQVFFPFFFKSLIFQVVTVGVKV